MKRKKIDCKTARKISIESVLSRLGLYPEKYSEREASYLSPFRQEKKASFKICKIKNEWFDHGDGRGGNVIDFVIHYENCTVSEALSFLNPEGESFSFHQPKLITEIKKDQPYKISKICELDNLSLIKYLKERKINITLAQKYCSEIHYSYNNAKRQSTNSKKSQCNNAIKTYYGIAFINDNGHYEIRNKYFKGCLGSKAITTIDNNSDCVSVFESFTDFLSYLTLGLNNAQENFIITNSTALVKTCAKELSNFKKVKTFFDNDEAGKKATKILKDACKVDFEDCSFLYKNHKDLNEYLINKTH